jgi:photoactive yellow protein
MNDGPFHPFLCSWCGTAFGQTFTAGSHGICPACYRQILELPDLSPAELAALPYGVILLDPDGVILSYNPAEERLSHRSARQVVGLNFFRDVAPCTQVKEFEGRFQSFVASASAPEHFSFPFLFPYGSVEVTIAFVRASGQGALVLVRAGPGAVPGSA